MSRNMCCYALSGSDGKSCWMEVSINFSMTWLDKVFICDGWRTMMQSHSCTPVMYPWFISHDLYFSMIIQQVSTLIVHHAWAPCNTIQQKRIIVCFESRQHWHVVARVERVSATKSFVCQIVFNRIVKKQLIDLCLAYKKSYFHTDCEVWSVKCLWKKCQDWPRLCLNDLNQDWKSKKRIFREF